jgi:uncharacterized protein (TIGR03067 family)
MFTAPLLLAALLAPADAPTPPPDAAVSDAGELRGEWEGVRVFFGGNDATSLFDGDRWAFAGGSATFIPAKRGPVRTMAVRADPTAATPTIDRGRTDGTFSPGVYRHGGDELLWAVDLAGYGRPTSFEPTPGVSV